MIKNNYLRFLLWYTVRANCHSFKNCRFYVLKVEFWELDFSLKISLFDFFNYIKSELLHQQNKSFNFFFFLRNKCKLYHTFLIVVMNEITKTICDMRLLERKKTMNKSCCWCTLLSYLSHSDLMSIWVPNFLQLVNWLI